MTDPGYGPNGQRLTTSGRISFEANGPILTINSGDDVWTIDPLGVRTVPFISQTDDEAITYIYPGGVL